MIIWLYIALHRTPNLDCYWVGAVPKFCILLEAGFLEQVQVGVALDIAVLFKAGKECLG